MDDIEDDYRAELEALRRTIEEAERHLESISVWAASNPVERERAESTGESAETEPLVASMQTTARALDALERSVALLDSRGSPSAFADSSEQATEDVVERLLAETRDIRETVEVRRREIEADLGSTPGGRRIEIQTDPSSDDRPATRGSADANRTSTRQSERDETPVDVDGELETLKERYGNSDGREDDSDE